MPASCSGLKDEVRVFEAAACYRRCGFLQHDGRELPHDVISKM
jgi:hypothetical protein